MTIQFKENFKNLIPVLSSEEYNQLESNIIKEGCRDALIVWRNGSDWLLDGHNRYEICKKHGIEFKTILKEFDNESEAKQWIILNQFGRRNLSLYQRSVLALKFENIYREQGKENLKISGLKYGKGCQMSDNPIKKVDARKSLDFKNKYTDTNIV